ncbi:hypothetical protein F5141DRAFT_1060167 [Pisolithus sp. B1]|nr:hypothetical protein F5141DRAFT_1060167 [Pisolithus sp. B1]
MEGEMKHDRQASCLTDDGGSSGCLPSSTVYNAHLDYHLVTSGSHDGGCVVCPPRKSQRVRDHIRRQVYSASGKTKHEHGFNAEHSGGWCALLAGAGYLPREGGSLPMMAGRTYSLLAPACLPARKDRNDRGVSCFIIRRPTRTVIMELEEHHADEHVMFFVPPFFSTMGYSPGPPFFGIATLRIIAQFINSVYQKEYFDNGLFAWRVQPR